MLRKLTGGEHFVQEVSSTLHCWSEDIWAAIKGDGDQEVLLPLLWMNFAKIKNISSALLNQLNQQTFLFRNLRIYLPPHHLGIINEEHIKTKKNQKKIMLPSQRQSSIFEYLSSNPAQYQIFNIQYFTFQPSCSHCFHCLSPPSLAPDCKNHHHNLWSIWIFSYTYILVWNKNRFFFGSSLPLPPLPHVIL